jgi:UPF0755 protein
VADSGKLPEEPLRERYEERKEREEQEATQAILMHGMHVLFKIAVAAVFAMTLFYGIRWAYNFGYSVFTTPTVDAPPGRNVEFTVLEGQSVRSVGEELVQSGLTASSAVFAVQARIYGYEILPGTYTLNTSQTIYEMLRIMSAKPAE